MDRVEEPTDEDEISFAPTPSPAEARAKLAALRGKPLDAPGRLVTEETPVEPPAAVEAAGFGQPAAQSDPTTAEMFAALRRFLDAEALKTGPQKPASAPKADKPLFKVMKVRITTRIDADVLEAFKATGPGWQTRMNDVLRENMP